MRNKLLSSCNPGHKGPLDQNFACDVHGAGTTMTFRTRQRFSKGNIRGTPLPEYHVGLIRPCAKQVTNFLQPGPRRAVGSEFRMRRTRDRITTGHPSQRLGKTWARGETGGFHMISYVNQPDSPHPCGRTPPPYYTRGF